MDFLSLWNILGTVAIIAFVSSFFMGKNAIWGTATLGLIVALMAGFFFNWLIFKKILIISVLVGILFELIGRLSNLGRSKINRSS